MARQSDRWLMSEVKIYIPSLTPEGRDAVVAFLRATADKVAAKKCEDNWAWGQPERAYKLKVGR